MKISKVSRIRNGEVYSSFRIYCGRDSYGNRIYKYAQSETKAKEILNAYKQACCGLDKRLLSLHESEKLEYFAIRQRCKEYNTNLSELWQFWFKRKSEASVLLQDCCGRFMDELQKNQRRKSYIATMRQFTNHLTETFSERHISSITIDELNNHYLSKPIKSRVTWRKWAVTFWGWCVKHEYCKTNIAEKLSIPLIEKELPYVLTIEQIKTLLINCNIKCLGGLILMLFGGIRPNESKQIGWSDIDLNAKTIRISGSVAKTRSFRLVPISSNMLEWFKYLQDNKMCLPYTQNTKTLTAEFARAVGVKSWWRDCLRHTSASMMLARDKSAEKVALDLGNSPDILHRHYKNLVTEQDMIEFWNIKPIIRK